MSNEEKQQAQNELEGHGIKASVALHFHDVRTVEEAADEVRREMNVRLRIYPRWLKEGQISQSESRDRMDRIMVALDLLDQTVTQLRNLPSL